MEPFDTVRPTWVPTLESEKEAQRVDPAAAPEPCNHSVGFCTGYCEHADVWRAYMDHKHP